MNSILIEDIQKEFLTSGVSKDIQEAVMQQQAGEIHISLMNGRLHKITTMPMTHLGDKVERLKYEGFIGLVDLVVRALDRSEQRIANGSLVITYNTGEDGMLKYLNLCHKKEVLHKTDKITV